MIQHFITMNTFKHQVDCFCPGVNHEEILIINEGDVIEVTSERKHAAEKGWYVLIVINNFCIFFIAVDELEKYYKEHKILSLTDLELKMNYLKYQINQALDQDDKRSFLAATEEVGEVHEYKLKLEKHIQNIKVRN